MFATTWRRTFDQSAFTVGKTQIIMEETSDWPQLGCGVIHLTFNFKGMLTCQQTMNSSVKTDVTGH